MKRMYFAPKGKLFLHSINDEMEEVKREERREKKRKDGRRLGKTAHDVQDKIFFIFHF